MESREAEKGTIVKLIENESVLAEVEVNEEQGKGLIYMVFDKDGDNVSVTSGLLKVSSRDIVEATKLLVKAFCNTQECPEMAKMALLTDIALSN